MKRKGTVLDGEQDKKKSAVAAAAAPRNNANESAFKLPDLANELLVQVYSHLNFKERQVTRKVCRRFLEFVDNSTPGAKELQVKVALVQKSRLQDIKMRPNSVDADAVCLEIHLPHEE